MRPDTSAFSINQGDVLSITPIRTNLNIPFSWKVRQVYALRIDSTAKDINGNMLNPSFEMTFVPEPYFRVKTISPPSGAVNVNSNSLQIAFNGPVDTSIHSLITLAPAVDGLWHYVRFGSTILDSSTIVFQTSSQFAVGTAYTISIGNAAVDTYGDSLKGGFTSSFTTIPFTVLSTSPGDGSTNWPVSQRTISVTLTDSLDVSTVKGAFRIAPSTAGAFSYSSNLRSMTFHSLNDLLPETAYTVTIDSSIGSKSGARIPQPYGFSFMTGKSGATEGLQVVFSSPANGDSTFFPLGIIRIYFNTAIDPASVPNAFSITPPVDGLISYPSSGQIVFSPVRSFSTSTLYTVALATSIASTNGEHLASRYTVSFRTLPFEIISTSPSTGQTHIATGLSRIWIAATDFIDTSTVRRAFSISPAVSGSLAVSPNYNSFYFNLSAPLQRFMIYTVTISDSLVSGSGIMLASPYSFRFATGE